MSGEGKLPKPYYQDDWATIYHGDCRDIIPQLLSQIDCIITSPPYWGLRDYGNENQIGLESEPEKYVKELTDVFGKCRKILSADGTLWLNLGDSYAWNCSRTSSGRAGMGDEREGIYVKGGKGLKVKDLVGIPWRTAFSLQADGWYLRQDIIWHKPNPMPESVTDRCTKSHEYIFLLSKNGKYYFNQEAIKEKAIYAGFDRGISSNVSPKGITPFGGHKNMNIKGKQPNSFHKARGNGEKDQKYDDRNKRSVWTVATKPFAEAHFATFPEDLITPCVLAGCPEGGRILDPFMGAGTTLKIAKKFKRQCVGIELNEEYINIAIKRLRQEVLI